MKPSCVTVQQYHTDDLVHWPVVRQAGANFLRQVEKFYVFGESVGTTSALLFTYDHACYAIGFNQNGELGLGHTNAVNQPTEIVELRGCNVVQCISRGCGSVCDYVMIVTSDGDLWQWGSLWEEEIDNNQNPLCPTLIMQQVAMVADGRNAYVVALHRDGTLWFWGNYGYLYERLIINPPTRMTGLATEQRIVHIQTGDFGCLAFSEEARFYHWKFPFDFYHSRPTKIQLPFSLRISTFSCGGRNVIMLNEDGYAYYGYFANYEFRCKPVEKLNEPMLSGTYIGTDNFYQIACLQSRSGQMIIWDLDKEALVRTALTSLADISVLYGNHKGTPVLTTFSPKAASEQVLQSIRNFHNPATSDFVVSIGFKQIYLHKPSVSRLTSFFATVIPKILPNGAPYLTEYSYVSGFNFLRYVHTGEVGVIDFEWIDQLLALATEGGIAELHDLCLHLINTHWLNGINVLTQSKHWQTVLSNLANVLNVTNSCYYLSLDEIIRDEALQNRAWMSIAKQSLSTARKVMSNLQVLSGQSSEVSALEIPDQYLQLILDHSDESGLIDLLQDPWQGVFFSNHFALTVSSDNCFRIFRLAVESKNETLQEKVEQFVANLENSFGLCLTEDFGQAESDLIKTLFTKVGVKRFRRYY